MNPRRLYRSSDDRWIGGVAGGVAEYFDVDPVLVRVIWLVSVPLTGGLSFLAYLIMLIVVPLGPEEWPQPSPWQPGGAPVGYGAAHVPPAASADAATGTETPPPGAEGTAGAPGTAPAANQFGPTQGPDWRWQRRADRWQRRADRWEQRAGRRGSGGLVFGVLLIVVGSLIAWHEIDPRLDLGLVGPIAVIIFGAFLVVSSVGLRRGE